MILNNAQIDFLWSLDYLSKDEIRDLMQGYTDLDVLLDVEDLEKFKQIEE